MFASVFESPGFYGVLGVFGLIAVGLLYALVFRRRTESDTVPTAADSGGTPTTAPPAGDIAAVASDEPESEAITLVGAADDWFKANRVNLPVIIHGAATVTVDAQGAGTIDGKSVEFDGEQEFAVLNQAELRLKGRIKIASVASVRVQVGEKGWLMLPAGGKVGIVDNTSVTLEEGMEMRAENLLSVSASFTLPDGVTITATGCQSVFSREGLRLLAARCGIVYATDGNVFAYRCAKVHATRDAVVYAVKCDEVAATERSKVCHHQCGKVWKRDDAVLEKQDVGHG